MIPYPLDANIRSSADLTSLYRQYLRVLNNRTFDLMSRFVARRCVHNGHRMSAQEYSQLIKPGATFCADEIVADVAQRTIAARLHIEFPSSYPDGQPHTRAPLAHAHDRHAPHHPPQRARLLPL
jgi:predicted ester cyclase